MQFENLTGRMIERLAQALRPWFTGQTETALIQFGDRVVGSALEQITPRIDNLQDDLAASTGASLVGFQQSGTGAVARTMQDKARERVSVKDFGAVGDGVANDTDEIRRAMLAHDYVVFPIGVYRIDYNGLTLRSGMTLEFEGGASIKLLPHNQTSYQILKIHDVDNVTLINPSVDGSRELNGAVTGEHGHGISILGAANIRIENPKTTGCWGDGIYIGASVTGGDAYCENVRIVKHHSNNDSRNGCSVISVKGLRIVDPLWENVNRTAPMTGCDIEPNNNAAFLEDIVIENPRTRACGGSGIGVVVHNLATVGGSADKNLSITINNHVDDGSLHGGVTHGCMLRSGAPAFGKVSGHVTWNNPSWFNSQKSAYRHTAWAFDAPLVRVIRPTVVNCNTTADAADHYNCAFSCDRTGTGTGNMQMGQLSIELASVTLTATTIARIMWGRDVQQLQQMANVNFIDPLVLKMASIPSSQIRGSGGIHDRFRIYNITATGNVSIDNTNLAGTYKSQTSAATTFTLSATMPAGQSDLIFEVSTTGQACIVTPTGAGKFAGMALGATLTSDQAGDYLRVRPRGSGVWSIIEKVGSWA